MLVVGVGGHPDCAHHSLAWLAELNLNSTKGLILKIPVMI
jgi:hypothetical protein